MRFHPQARSLTATVGAAFFLIWSVSAAWAANEALTLEAALPAGSEYAATVVTARSALATARNELDVSAADPSTTPLTLATRERAVAAAEDDLTVAVATANGEVVSAYAAVLEAKTTAELAVRQLDILQRTLEATRARFEAGAVTAADVVKAENDVASQQRTLQEADVNLTFANDSLAVLLGYTPGVLTPLTEADLLPQDALEDVTARTLKQSARLSAAQRSLDAARAQLRAVNNALSSRAEIEAAEKAVTSSEEALTDMVAVVERDVQRAYAAVDAASNRYQGTMDSVASAMADLAAQDVRLAAGTISDLAFAQSALSLENARSSASNALHALLSAQYALRLAEVR